MFFVHLIFGNLPRQGCIKALSLTTLRNAKSEIQNVTIRLTIFSIPITVCSLCSMRILNRCTDVGQSAFNKQFSYIELSHHKGLSCSYMSIT